MSNKFKQSIIGGLLGTAVMTVFIGISVRLGMPEMNIPEMLATMVKVPVFVGWLLHFMIGFTLAILYSFYLINILRKIKNIILSGVIFGIIAFVIAQASFGVIGVIYTMTPVEGGMGMILLSSLMSHIVFGIVVSIFAKENTPGKLLS